MKPFRKHVALAIDGGGMRGVIAARALAILEQALGQSSHSLFRLVAGTSTGAILSVGIAAGLRAGDLYTLYTQLGDAVFKKTLRARLWPLTRYRYPLEPLSSALHAYLGNACLGDFWQASPPTDLVITSFDLVTNHTRFIKPWKDEYRDWPAALAALASSVVPTYFPVVAGRYVDGGVGSYANPCYLAAYEACYYLQWDPLETTLISLGTGREPHKFQPGEADGYWAWDWIGPMVNAFLQSADDQQVSLVQTFFERLDFRRFQVDLQQSIEMDDPTKNEELTAYGDELANMILNDLTDPAQDVSPRVLPAKAVAGVI